MSIEQISDKAYTVGDELNCKVLTASFVGDIQVQEVSDAEQPKGMRQKRRAAAGLGREGIPFNPGWLRTGFSYWIMTIPNILGSVDRELLADSVLKAAWVNCRAPLLARYDMVDSTPPEWIQAYEDGGIPAQAASLSSGCGRSEIDPVRIPTRCLIHIEAPPQPPNWPFAAEHFLKGPVIAAIAWSEQTAAKLLRHVAESGRCLQLLRSARSAMTTFGVLYSDTGADAALSPMGLRSPSYNPPFVRNQLEKLRPDFSNGVVGPLKCLG
eukprot:s2235_g7.t1